MALKAGRVGVAKDQVDEFGRITGSTPENVYTKQQCDNKFETKTHATNTFQQKNIEVPLELLGGSQLTVEASLHALEDTLGTLQFRDNDGTAQYKLPNGDWANFNSGGTLGYAYYKDVTADGITITIKPNETVLLSDNRLGTTRRYIPSDSDIAIVNLKGGTIGRVMGSGSLTETSVNKVTNNGSVTKEVKFYYTSSSSLDSASNVYLIVLSDFAE